MRYVELNPLRAGIVPKSDDYCSSSARAHIRGSDDPMLACHELYLRLGETSVAQTARAARCLRRSNL
jgi:REP-associated tyrosine transposase